MPFGHEFGPMKLFLSFPAKTHPIHHFRYKNHVLGGFAPFGCCKCTVAKSGPRMPFWHEFRPTKLFRDFLPKRIQSTTLGLKLMFWVVSHHLVAAKCSFAKSGPGIPFLHEFGLTKLLSSFLAKMHPIHYFRSKTHILGGFAPFVCSKCTVVKSVPRLLFWHESRPTKLFSSFSAKTSNPLRSV